MNDRLLKESDVLKIAYQLPYVVNSAFFDAVKALPSADGPTVVRVKTIMKKEDYDNLEKRIKQQNPNVIVIPYNAELVTPADRPQGEWIYCEDYVGHDGYECSNCGFFIPWAYDCYTDSNFILNYHTCPHCDAKMKGAGDEAKGEE